jgi:hypothetical protein
VTLTLKQRESSSDESSERTFCLHSLALTLYRAVRTASKSSQSYLILPAGPAGAASDGARLERDPSTATFTSISSHTRLQPADEHRD